MAKVLISPPPPLLGFRFQVLGSGKKVQNSLFKVQGCARKHRSSKHLKGFSGIWWTFDDLDPKNLKP
jgi:hypothetical protein